MVLTNHARKGVVYLIGAGPGDPDLITLKGKAILTSCDAVVFDDLISLEHLVTLPLNVEKHYVGKRPGKHTKPQSEINALLVELARQGKSVARLKGGDPFIFGRGGEEALYLRENGIEFEIVPGVTAGIAVPSYCGIPCTDRRKSSYVIFATGHKSVDKEGSSRVPWDLLSSAETGTIVIYMGVSELENIVSQLINGGMPPEKPIAVIERGTFSSQNMVVSKLSDIAQKVRRAGIKSPAIIIIGDVVGLQDELAWFGKGPLAGLRVMVARPADQATEIYGRIRSLGAEVLEYPTIATESFYDESAWNYFKSLSQQPCDPTRQRWIAFTSQNGLRYFLSQLADVIGDIRSIGNFKIASVGYGTEAALVQAGLKPDFVPEKQTVATLASEFIRQTSLANADIFRVRGNLGDTLLEDEMTRAGAKVIPMQVYRTFYPDWPDWIKDQLLEYPPDAILFTSGSSVDGFFHALGDDAPRLLVRARTFSIGPTTTEVARSNGHEISFEARQRSIPGLIDELLKSYENNPVKPGGAGV